MPPEENKTQIPLEPTDSQNPASNGTGTPQQGVAQTEPIVETPAPVEQPAETAPIVEKEEIAEPAPVVEPPKIEEAQPQVVEEEPIAPTAQSAEPQPKPTPQPQIQERIVYKIDPNIVQKLLIKARAKIQERKRKKLDKIMALFEAKTQVTNKDIQKLLKISSATTVRYMNILEQENRIKQVGNTGKSVFYTKI